MPRRDGTGPNGQGSFTGKGFGKCLAYGIPAVAGAIAVFGFGREYACLSDGCCGKIIKCTSENAQNLRSGRAYFSCTTRG